MKLSRSNFQRIKRDIRSLQLKKNRRKEQRFTVEGRKSVLELLESDYQVYTLIGTPTFLTEAEMGSSAVPEVIEVTAEELAGIGDYQTNDAALAVAGMKPNLPLYPSENEYALVLDDIRDPGNLGTIIRTADWYGIKKIIASEQTADLYNAKVIQASMGSFLRVGVFYTSLENYLASVSRPVWGAFMKGLDAHLAGFGTGGLLVIGNEARGVSPELEPFITQKVTIPRYGQAESLNAAVACAILLDNLKRSHKKV